jgi:hypothetical protein
MFSAASSTTETTSFARRVISLGTILENEFNVAEADLWASILLA